MSPPTIIFSFIMLAHTQLHTFSSNSSHYCSELMCQPVPNNTTRIFFLFSESDSKSFESVWALLSSKLHPPMKKMRVPNGNQQEPDDNNDELRRRVSLDEIPSTNSDLNIKKFPAPIFYFSIFYGVGGRRSLRTAAVIRDQ